MILWFHQSIRRVKRKTCVQQTEILCEKIAIYCCSSSHGIGLLFLSVAVATIDRQFSRIVAFFHAVASNPPQLHIARYDWVYPAASSQKEAFRLLMRLNDDNLHQVNSELWTMCPKRRSLLSVTVRCVGHSDFNIGHMAGVRYTEDLPNGPHVKGCLYLQVFV